MKANIEIPDVSLMETATILNTLLADEFLLYTKTRKAHWNIQGMEFYDLHKFFEEQYDQLADMIDEVAERVRMLGHYALGTMKDFLAVTRLKETETEFSDEQEIIRALLEDHEAIIRTLRRDAETTDNTYHDLGTTDFLTSLIGRHEKMAWMLRAHLN